MTAAKLKILIVDDHQILIDGIEAMLQDVDNFEVVGKLLDGKLALSYLTHNPVDILLTDLYMPKMTGIELTQKVKKDFPDVKVLALSVSYDVSIVHDLMDAGISGFILKTIGRGELIEAINEVSKGNVYFSREVSNEILRSLANRNDLEEETYRLTDREIEILKLIAQEFSNADIAKQLYISERTVETHRKNIYRKTNTKTIVGLIKYAVERKLI
ncbi:response regulator transcription factor [Emticicia sp. BO119]|uniref:response regulator n=1 Tax=Emticicia sp. BO119 TaxID=2757768 RepID=UPI0015F08F08|nr:response regulator transcription factor [Emticicia sp. BO119]MBA4852493.1 response regulator transcription factor [Emticicia sp. BO119]